MPKYLELAEALDESYRLNRFLRDRQAAEAIRALVARVQKAESLLVEVGEQDWTGYEDPPLTDESWDLLKRIRDQLYLAQRKLPEAG